MEAREVGGRGPGEWIDRFRRGIAEAPEPSLRAGAAWLALLAAYFVYRALVREPLETWERGAFILCAIFLPFPGRTRRIAAAVALVWFYLSSRLRAAPFTAANHEWLEAFLLAVLVAAPSGYGGVRRLFMATAVIVIAMTGIQKAVNGYYFHGDYFTLSVAQPSEKFAGAAMPRLSEAERAEYREFHVAYRSAVNEGVPGVLDRPIPRAPSVVWLSRAACWLTLLVELFGPLFLIPRRTRRIAAAVLVVFFLGVEAVAHEWVFGALTAILLIPFLAPRPAAAPARTPGTVSFAASAALLAILVVWPFVQMTLVRTTGLSPWKLAGFGMYSEPSRFGDVVVESRQPGSTSWKRRPPADAAERRYYAGRSYVLRHAPFLRSAAEGLADLAFQDGAEEVRVRSLTMTYDRAIDRFRLEEREFTFSLRP